MAKRVFAVGVVIAGILLFALLWVNFGLDERATEIALDGPVPLDVARDVLPPSAPVSATPLGIEEGTPVEGTSATEPEGATIEVYVFDKDTGEGFEGFHAYVDRYGSDTIHGYTNAEGIYRFTGLARGNWEVGPLGNTGNGDSGEAHLTLRGKGHVRRIDIPIEVGIVLSGRVLNREGETVPGVQVTARNSIRSRARSNSDGVYRLPGLRAGDEILLRAGPHGYAPEEFGPYVIPGGGLSGVDIVLVPESKISGVVVDRNGKEVPFNYVHALDEAGHQSHSNISRPLTGSGVEAARKSGGFTLRRLTRGTYRLYAGLPSNLGGGVFMIPKKDETEPLAVVEVGEGEHLSGIRLVLDIDAVDPFESAGRDVSGYVRNGDGEPVEGAQIEVANFDTLLTDEDGYFEAKVIENTPLGRPGDGRSLRVKAEGYAPHRVPGSEFGPSPLDIVLEGAVGVLGVVTDAESGEAIREFELSSIYFRDPKWKPDRYYEFKRIEHPNGEFVLDNLRNRDFNVVVRASGYALAFVIVEVVPGEMVEVEVTLEKSALIEGTVVDPSGNPVEGAQVGFGEVPEEFWTPRRLRNAVFTDGDGSFALDSLPSDLNELYAIHADFFPASVEFNGAPGELTQVQIALGIWGED